MLRLFRRNRFDNDLRRMQKRGKKIAKLWDVVEILMKDHSLPIKHRNHKLSGDMEGLWDCHIEPDWILIYEMTDTTLTLLRTGTHADLFS